jgi:hypothetical protein
VLPHKEPRKSKHNPDTALTTEHKQANRVLSQTRILVEHALAGIKRYTILTQP